MAWVVDVRRAGLYLAILTVGLAGCGTVGGWFGMGETTSAKTKPAELAEIKATVTLAKAWEASVGPGRPYVFTPASDGQAAYAAGKDGRIVKLDLATGREVWRTDSGQTLSAGVGVGDGLVLVGTPKGELLAYRAADGQPAWKAKLSGEILTVPVAGAGMVAARGNDGKIWLLDARDGKQRWVYSRGLPARIRREPGNLLLTGRAVFAGHPGGKLTALSLANGGPLWETNVALPRGTTELERIADVAGALAADEQMVCAGAYQGRLGCFDQSNGNAVWSREFSGLTGVEMGERFVYAADEHAILQAHDKLRGTSLWRQDKLRERKLGTPLALTSQVAVADFQGYVHLLNLEDGALIARAATDGSPVVGQMLPLNSGLIAQTANGGIYAFRVQ